MSFDSKISNCNKASTSRKPSRKGAREGLARKAMLKWVKHKNKSHEKPAAIDVEVQNKIF